MKPPQLLMNVYSEQCTYQKKQAAQFNFFFFFTSVLVILDAFCIWGPTELLSSLYEIRA